MGRASIQDHEDYGAEALPPVDHSQRLRAMVHCPGLLAALKGLEKGAALPCNGGSAGDQLAVTLHVLPDGSAWLRSFGQSVEVGRRVSGVKVDTPGAVRLPVGIIRKLCGLLKNQDILIAALDEGDERADGYLGRAVSLPRLEPVPAVDSRSSPPLILVAALHSRF